MFRGRGQKAKSDPRGDVTMRFALACKVCAHARADNVKVDTMRVVNVDADSSPLRQA
jgi:hypothetical protein